MNLKLKEKIRNMNFYRWDPRTLSPLLPPFVGGQFRLAKVVPGEDPKAMLMFQGQIRTIEAGETIKRVMIRFDWLCERRFFLSIADNTFTAQWLPVPPSPSGESRLTVDYQVYYPQASKKRLKIKGYGGEFCRLYLRGDPDNISEEDFAPTATLLTFEPRVVASLTR